MTSVDIDRALALDAGEALAELLRLPEGQWLERKSGRIGAKELAVPLVAMANAEGGHVVVGLHDGAVDGVSDSRINALRQAAQDFTVPVVRCAVSELHDRGRTVLVFQVEPGEQVHETVRGDVYLRVGDESRKLGYAQRRELEYDRGSAPFDGTGVDASSGDLGGRQVAAFQNAIGSSSPERMLAARDLLTRDGRLTVAGWLLFSERPQSLFPSAVVRVLRYGENERGTGAGMSLLGGGDVRCEGSIPEQITRAAEVIEDWVPRIQALRGTGRFESRPMIPRDVWLEGLVNAVLHRSYSMAGDHVRVEIFPNRIEISSPGRFPGLADPSRPLSISRYARNPRIVRVCSDLGIARELGEGIKRIFTEMRRIGLTDPIYAQDAGSVRLVLSSADAVPTAVLSRLSAGARAVLDTLRLEGRPLSTGQVADLTGTSRPTAGRHLRSLQSNGLVVWEGQSPRDPRASWRLGSPTVKGFLQ
ncbi:transcriptional regulator [Acidipropionibacterium acidipropionici]|jgi:ATP-dependent DNA helicase RecG|uniref:Transcriptional regulator n=1 Tax=Acidipropionibacterium acidipropionici TaxID=1748 RepID=A0AAC9ANV7_9ACTN|nr:ATP-binding protein [Acidipropionibacterium acidipropionici]AMS06012.1 transcriptional regulator [Acidipropionibacterium acidipropionici]AOZ47475.1 transcriptional regulator [Acidipropionibacterium acidipropionici]AZP39202.1 transcriptional regulator [Acidipropionibacterium acidipropionici]QCV96156.1 transcriptional regulator [Acidipropionibacterium acidipropionici]